MDEELVGRLHQQPRFREALRREVPDFVGNDDVGSRGQRGRDDVVIPGVDLFRDSRQGPSGSLSHCFGEHRFHPFAASLEPFGVLRPPFDQATDELVKDLGTPSRSV